VESGVVEGAGAALAWCAEGDGEPTCVVHDIAGDAAQWAPALARLPGRAVAYDRRGYGGSTAPEPYTATTVEEQAEDLAALLHALGAVPARLLGDGFGALIALDLAKRHPSLVRELVLVDTPLYAFVPAATESMAAMRLALENALRAGGTAAAIAVWLAGEPSARVARAQARPEAFFADYAGLSSWPVTRRELRALALPVAVLTRPGAAPYVLAASDALAALLPSARREVDGDPVTAHGA
jgi:pimeloyl-ACP methyl ester carboxylesterase